MDRRSFVKGCLTAAGVGTAAAAGLSLGAPSVKIRPAAGDPIEYYGFHKVGGPAPRGTPLIPVGLNDAGELFGKIDVTTPTNTPDGVLDWFKYCGHAAAPGLTKDFQSDNVLRYFIAEEKIAQGVNVWYKDRLGDAMKPGDFAPGQGAGFIWRSEGQKGASLVTGVVIRLPPLTSPRTVSPEAPRVVPPGKRLKESEWTTVKDEYIYATDDAVFVAASTYCPHFCCIPGWKEAEKLASSVTDPVNSGTGLNRLFCTCHFSIYSPYQIVRYTFQPETTTAAPGGAH